MHASSRVLLRLGLPLLLLWTACSGGSKLVNDPATDTGDRTTQSEPSITTLNDLVVVGYNDSGQFAATQSFTGYAYSTDNGNTFVDAGTLAPVPGGMNVGDPSLAVDGSGTIFFATLASDAASASFIGVARSTSTSPTVTFGLPVLIPGLDPNGFQDKELIAVDATGGTHDGNVYVVWTEFPSAAPTRILFSRSTNGGVSYSTATQLSTSGTSVSGAIPLVGPGGEVYVAWQDRSAAGASRIVFRRSTNGGATFSGEVTAANFTRTRNAAATASCSRPALRGNIRINEFPTISVDASGGPNNGNLYIAYPGDPDGQGAGDESDIFVVRSTNGGVTWSAPVNVTKGPAVTSGADGTNNDNFFPFSTVDHAGGVHVFFYDRRNDAANTNIRLYRAVSTDGGLTWQNKAASSSFGVPPLNPNFDPIVATCYMGDYNFVVPNQMKLYTVWGDNRRTITTVGFPGGRPDPDVRFQKINP